MNQANIAYWIGTDVRRDLAVPYSHMYPGPGGGLEEYYPYDPMTQTAPYVSFPKDQQKNYIEKTNDPGPGTYTHFDTVGVVAGYNKEEKHPRVSGIPAKKYDDE